MTDRQRASMFFKAAFRPVEDWDPDDAYSVTDEFYTYRMNQHLKWYEGYKVLERKAHEAAVRDARATVVENVLQGGLFATFELVLPDDHSQIQQRFEYEFYVGNPYFDTRQEIEGARVLHDWLRELARQARSDQS